MNKIIGKLMIVCLSVVLFASCQDEDESFGIVFETNQETVVFDMNADTKYVRVNSNRSFSVSSSQAWCVPEILENSIENLKISVDESSIIGKSRTAQVVVSSEGSEDIVVNVQQSGIPVELFSEPCVVIVETGNEFALKITANVPFTFTLPEWIHEKNENVVSTGVKNYYFTLAPLLEGEDIRSGNVIVKAIDPELNKSLTIPVTQGKEDIEGITKDAPYIIEAESSLEGYTAKQQEWWASSGQVFGADYYISAYEGNNIATYAVMVVDEGSYNVSFEVACWGGGKLELLVDEVSAGTVDLPSSDGETSTIVDIREVTLNAGRHVLKVCFTGNSDFNKFTVTSNE